MEFDQLSMIEKNVLVASILGDGEITKCYKGSRRKNNSYREHFSKKQLQYRVWKKSMLPNIFYFNNKMDTLKFKSLGLFTELFPLFYNSRGEKRIPETLLKTCTHPIFLAILYMDDGSLTISKKVNSVSKVIYLTPNINFYVQCFPIEQIALLQNPFYNVFKLKSSINRRKDGFGYILRITSTQGSMRLYIQTCPSMYYKTNWPYRFELEKIKLKNKYRDFNIKTSVPKAYYSTEEIEAMVRLKSEGMTDKEIAKQLGRSYWSVVYKLSELRKDGRLK